MSNTVTYAASAAVLESIGTFKVLIANDFDTTKNPKLVPNWKGPGEIIDINDTNARIKFKNKIKVLNVSKLKHFFENVEKSAEKESEAETFNQNFNQSENAHHDFNDIFNKANPNERPNKVIEKQTTAVVTISGLAYGKIDRINSIILCV